MSKELVKASLCGAGIIGSVILVKKSMINNQKYAYRNIKQDLSRWFPENTNKAQSKLIQINGLKDYTILQDETDQLEHFVKQNLLTGISLGTFEHHKVSPEEQLKEYKKSDIWQLGLVNNIFLTLLGYKEINNYRKKSLISRCKNIDDFSRSKVKEDAFDCFSKYATKKELKKYYSDGLRTKILY